MTHLEPTFDPSSPSAAPIRHPSERAVVAYVAPMFAYIGSGALESLIPGVGDHSAPALYPIVYASRVVLVGVVAWLFRWTWRDLAPFPGRAAIMAAILTGLVIFGLWVGLDGLYPELPFLGRRVGFDPSVLSRGARTAFIAVRMVGLVALVPLIEELFWRSFLIRWLIDADFQAVAIGRVTPASTLLTALFFAFVHPEWLPALLTGLIWAGLLAGTRSVSACVVSHAVANAALGAYVLVTGDWKYW